MLPVVSWRGRGRQAARIRATASRAGRAGARLLAAGSLCCFLDHLPFWKRPSMSEMADLISVSQAGFRPEDRKSAVLCITRAPASTDFVLRNTAGQTVYAGRGRCVTSRMRRHAVVLAFDDFARPGTYVVESNGLQSPPFAIAADAWRRADLGRAFDSFFRYQRRRDAVEGEPGKDHLALDRDLPVYLLDDEGRETDQGVRFADAAGGWYDATSTDKETVKNAYAAQALLLAYEASPGLFHGIEDKVLGEAAGGLRYLLKLQDEDGGVFLAVKPFDWWIPGALPRRILVNKCTGVTADAIAAWATAARILHARDPALAAECLARARRGWRWVREHPRDYLMDKAYPGYWTGRLCSVLWAAVELHAATRDRFPEEAAEYAAACREIVRGARFRRGVWVTKMGPHPASALATVTESPVVLAYARLYPHADDELKQRIGESLSRWFAYWNRTRDPAYGVSREALKPWFGMNTWVLQIGLAAMAAGDALGRPDMVRFGQDQVRWVLGNNPFGMSFVVGLGTRCHRYPFKRPLDDSLGGVVPGIIDTNRDGVPETAGTQAWQTDECTLDGTAALVWCLALLDR